VFSEPSYNSTSTESPSLLDELILGFKAFYAGLPLLLQNRSLLGLSLIPIAGSIALISLFAIGSLWFVNLWLEAAEPDVRVIVQTLVILIALFLGLTFYMPIARVVLAPFSEALSRKTIEVAGLGWLQMQRPNALRALWEGLKLVSLQVLIICIGAVLSFVIPVVGHALWVALVIVLCAMDYLDVPFSARGLVLREKLNLLWKYKARAFGFGIAAYIMLFIPFVNILSLPVGIIGATIMTSRMRQ
jgi:CysZ protein